jgi:hypothetical protein
MAERPPRSPLPPELELARRLVVAADPRQPWEADEGIDLVILDATRSIAAQPAAQGAHEVLAAAWRTIVARIVMDARAGRDVASRVNAVVRGLPDAAIAGWAWQPEWLPVIQVP